MDPIKIPKPPKKAFNPNRPASDLLRQQVRHLEWAIRHAGERRATFSRVKDVETEAEAALRTQQLLPKLALAESLPFSKASLEEAAALKKAKYTVSKTSPNKTTKKTAKPSKRTATSAKRRKTAKTTKGKRTKRATR